jgi:hypothetical protein
MRKSFVLVMVAIALGIFVAAPQAGAISITVGTIGGLGNAFPFGTPGPGTRYQQVYNQALFPAMSITDITFFRTGGSINAATYTIHLSTTSKLVNQLDTVNFSNNVGADDQFFWTGYLSGNPGPTLTFTGPGFNYDPIQGNLLVDIFKSGASGGLTGGFDVMYLTFGDDSSRAHNFGSGFEHIGLVTRFTGNPVPEPCTILLLGSGLAGLAGFRRRFKRS